MSGIRLFQAPGNATYNIGACAVVDTLIDVSYLSTFSAFYTLITITLIVLFFVLRISYFLLNSLDFCIDLSYYIGLQHLHWFSLTLEVCFAFFFQQKYACWCVFFFFNGKHVSLIYVALLGTTIATTTQTRTTTTTRPRPRRRMMAVI